MLLGTFLDAISNAIAIVKLPFAIVGSLAIFFGWVSIQYYLKYRPVDWKNADGSLIRIKRLGIRFSLPFVGMIILLWLPLGIQWFHSIELQPSNRVASKEDEIIIIVATFARAEGVDDAKAQMEIQRQIQETAADLDIPNLRVKVVPDILDYIYDERGRDVQALMARKLADDHEASIVIWGQETSVRITTRFLSLRNEPEEFWDIQFSWPRPANYVEHMTEIMPHYVDLITLTAIGELYFRDEEYTKATEILNFLINTTFSSLPKDEIQNSDARMSIALSYSSLGDIYLKTDPRRANSYYCLSQNMAPPILLSREFPENLECILPNDIN